MTGLRSQARDLAYRRVGGTAVVLIYHRVAAMERDPQLLAVTPENFDEQMRVLAAGYRAISLDDLVSAVRRRRVPDRAVVVTFDDGYRDNLTIAEPILAAYGIPATVFVSSGYASSQHEFWWDELERLVLAPGTLPERVAVETSGGDFESTLTDLLVYTEQDAERDAGWNVLTADTNARQSLYRTLTEFIRPLSAADREAALAQLRGVARPIDARSSGDAARPTHTPLSEREVAQLDSSAVVDVGSHTVSHPVLSALAVGEQRGEIFDDVEALTAILGRPPRTFSYPYGSLGDYTDETVALVREAGFVGACSNHLGVVKPWTDGFRVPRNIVRNWDAETFKAKLEGYFREQR
jgi:peptidoglycan/xylan/chitin deacetylase (PgdA/CDA1 family)